MTKFRPCIDLHDGKVKQIVGGTLTDNSDTLKENFVSDNAEMKETLSSDNKVLKDVDVESMSFDALDFDIDNGDLENFINQDIDIETLETDVSDMDLNKLDIDISAEDLKDLSL